MKASDDSPIRASISFPPNIYRSLAELAKQKKVSVAWIVRDAAVHERVCGEIGDWFAQIPGWRGLGIIPSPIEGGDGNREFLIAAMRDAR
jgi:23S rRNA (cytidine1920-2'-O)/16S rRNA (cytidine1409-2'-O)-methyltransferase